jgi:hypothetical protein
MELVQRLVVAKWFEQVVSDWQGRLEADLRSVDQFSAAAPVALLGVIGNFERGDFEGNQDVSRMR